MKQSNSVITLSNLRSPCELFQPWLPGTGRSLILTIAFSHWRIFFKGIALSGTVINFYLDVRDRSCQVQCDGSSVGRFLIRQQCCSEDMDCRERLATRAYLGPWKSGTVSCTSPESRTIPWSNPFLACSRLASRPAPLCRFGHCVSQGKTRWQAWEIGWVGLTKLEWFRTWLGTKWG